MFENLFGDKSWYQSVTAWGLVILVAAETALQAGLLPELAGTIIQGIGAVAVTLGLRKAATSTNV